MRRPLTLRLRDGELAVGRSFFLICGPCVIESEEHCLETAGRLKEICAAAGVPLVFKASFDKANRTSIRSFRGPGLQDGLAVLERVGKDIGVAVTTDIHLPEQAPEAAAVVDILQIPAFLCRQTDLLVAAAETGRAVNVKKGQFLAPWDMGNVVDKLQSAGCRQTLLTERGSSFGYNNLVVDFKALPILAGFGCPVVFDATHSVQLPGGAGQATGGQPEFIPVLASAAIAAGADGLFFEVHEDPEKALSDGANALQIDAVPSLLDRLLALYRVSTGTPQ